MRIVVISDAHGHIAPVEKAIENSKPDFLIYLGDGSEKIEDLSYLYNNIRFYIVAGNCDFGCDFPIQKEVKIGGKTLFFSHGHTYYVKSSYEKIISEAKNRNADIVLFGHTHVPVNEYDDGLYVMNPGSIAIPNVGRPSYGFIDIIDNKIVTNIVYL